MALAWVATGGHAQPSAGHLCCPVGGYPGPLPDSGAASRPCPAADWQPVYRSRVRHIHTRQCRMIYLEAFRGGAPGGLPPRVLMLSLPHHLPTCPLHTSSIHVRLHMITSAP